MKTSLIKFLLSLTFFFRLEKVIQCVGNSFNIKKFILDAKNVENCKKVCWQFGYHDSGYVKREDGRYDCICQNKKKIL